MKNGGGVTLRQKEVACETLRWKELVVVLKEQRREKGSVSGAQ